MNQKVVVRVLLVVLGLLLTAGLVIQYLPGSGGLNLFGGGAKGTPALKVNGQTVTAEELDRVRQSNPTLSLTRDGVLGEDFRTVIVDQQVRQVLLSQASKDIDVPRSEIADQVKQIRESNNLTKTKDWVDRLQQLGYTDASFRAQLRERAAIEKKAEQIQARAAKPTDAEAQLYYQLNPQAFEAEARIAGREIVVKDQKKAEELLAQARGGADFAKLASENSLENKGRGGALGSVKDGKVTPVTAIALPTEVSAAAFKLTEGGLTDVVKSGDRYYVVKVEQYLPAGVKPFAEVKADALKAVEAQKKNAEVEKWLDDLESKAKVEVVDKAWAYNNPTVATVNGEKIPYAEVLSAMLGNPSFGSLVQQGGAQAEGFVNGFFKPQVLDSLVQQYAAPGIVKKLGLALSGSRQELLAGLQAYGGRDAKVTDADVQAYYTAQKASFQTPGSANVSEASFKDRAAALAFRESFVKSGGDFTAAASKAGGTVSERGSVTAGQADPTTGQPKLDAAVQKAVFDSGRLATAGEGSVTDVVEQGGRFVVAFVTDLVKAETKSLADVRGQISEQLLTQKRTEEGQKFVQAQLKGVKVVNNLQTVIKAQEKRAAAEKAKQPAAPKSPTDTGSQGETKTPANSK
ncbi:peptidylprolyl isomerase [Deinococcus pimensis]|uniref:peptidylprolyl isomerase n=1 Tax=Deinococcus pimensis TaxID=309888 RepID=UPI00047F7272|nr:peptidylprolyl isomerase [Deinococcus pimensis]